METTALGYETIKFTRDGKEHVAVVQEPRVPITNAMIVEDDGVRYAISIPMGRIPWCPEAFIAHPVIEEDA